MRSPLSGQSKSGFLRLIDDSAGQRMLAVLLERSGDAQKLAFGAARGSQLSGHARLARGERAGLVSDEMRDALCGFEGLCILN